MSLFDRFRKPPIEHLTEAAANRIISNIVEAASAEAEFMLAQEDRGWMKLGDTQGIIPETSRRITVRRSRIANQTDGMCMQTIALFTNFCVGLGATIKARDTKAAQVLNDFTTDVDNERIMNCAGQRMLSDMIQEDGELMFVLFAAPKQAVKIRTLDSLEISEIITDPDDAMTHLWYVRNTGTGKQVAYRDWRNDAGIPGRDVSGNAVPRADCPEVEGAVVYHVKLQGRGVRGNPRLTPVLDWAVAHHRFMNSRIAIEEALAKFAYKLKANSNQSNLTTLAAAIESHVNKVRTDSAEKTKPGSMWFENQASSLSPMGQETGAASANTDGAMIIQRIGAGAGIFPHYYGAGDAFRLATATAMEPPMQKAFEGYQGLWLATWHAICEFVLANAGIPKGDRRKVDIDMPKIFPEQTAQAILGLTTLLDQFPEFAESEEVQGYALTLVGMNNVQDILDRLKEDAANAPPTPEPPTPPVVPPEEPEGEPVTEAGRIAVDDLIQGIDRILQVRKEGACNHEGCKA
jgi:hypothetical protein